MIDTKLILEYFDIKVIKNSDNTVKIKMTLKEAKKKKVSPIFRDKDKKYSFSGSSKTYYTNYLGDNIGKLVWESRKKLCVKKTLIEWYKSEVNTDSKLDLELNLTLEKLHSNMSKSHNKYFNSNEWNEYIKSDKFKEKQIAAGKKLSDKWKNDTRWRTSLMKERKDNKMYEKVSKTKKEKWVNDAEYREKMLKVFRQPKRREKISIWAKNMWNDAKLNNRDKFYRMLNSSKNKNFVINGYKMNSIEYQMATILNSLNLDWKYEKVFTIGKRGFLPDFTLEDKKIIIEVYGDYWHANPKYFTEDSMTHKTRSAKEVWEYDKNKKLLFENLGYKYIYVWEEDINTNYEKIKEMINENTK